MAMGRPEPGRTGWSTAVRERGVVKARSSMGVEVEAVEGMRNEE
jgi:hypothetical protein